MTETTTSAELEGNTFPFASLASFVERQGGTRVLQRILLSNNGIAAVKCMRSIRQWSFRLCGNARAVTFIAMVTPDDLGGNAEYIRLADEVVHVPGGSNAFNYANVAAIVAAARQTRADAVWAGWGHASENPQLPTQLARHGIVFLGPDAGPMRALGDKIMSTLIAQHADVPTIPWSGTGLTVDWRTANAQAGSDETNPEIEAVFAKACVQPDDPNLEQIAARVGYPLMIKASEGGGGKGIRKVTGVDELHVQLRRVQAEVPGSPIFLMKMASQCRHIEVQLIADRHGQAIALSGRDCSVQRRHQKIIEEGPPLIDQDVFLRMQRAAVRLAQEVGYSGAGTVEYLYDEGVSADESQPAKPQAYFLELNPRLQVEHPVTEMVTGVNLPAAQLQVAMGIRLDRIPDIRRFYGLSPYGLEPVPFFSTPEAPDITPLTPQVRGHCIAARITAENPERGFQPSNGSIQEITFRTIPNVWGYFSVPAGGKLHDYADSQFGHIFSWGDSREQARKTLVLSLQDLSLRGEVWDTVSYLTLLIQRKDFVDYNITTHWLDGILAHQQQQQQNEKSQSETQSTEALILSKTPTDESVDSFTAVVCAAVYRAFTDTRERQQEFIGYVERGQLPPPHLTDVVFSYDLIYRGSKYPTRVWQTGQTRFIVRLHAEGNAAECDVRPLPDTGILAVVDGRARRLHGRSDAATGLRLKIDSHTYLFTNEYDPAVLRAALPGKLVRYLQPDGAHVQAGDAFAEVEVMKMYLPLTVSESGHLRLIKAEGSVLAAGDVIGTLQLDDPSRVRRAALVNSPLPQMRLPLFNAHPTLVHRFREKHANLIHRLAGFAPLQPTASSGNAPSSPLATSDVTDFISQLDDPALPSSDLQDILSIYGGRIPSSLLEKLQQLDKAYTASLSEAPSSANVTLFSAEAQQIADYISEVRSSLPESDRTVYDAATSDLRSLSLRYQGGLGAHKVRLLVELLSRFVDVEARFDRAKGREDVLHEARARKEPPTLVWDLTRAHRHIQTVIPIVLEILEAMSLSQTNTAITTCISVLEGIAALKSKNCVDVARVSRQILMIGAQPSFAERLESLLSQLKRIVTLDSDPTAHPNGPGQASEERQVIFSSLIHQSHSFFDLLISLMTVDQEPKLLHLVFEVYIKRAFSAYKITNFKFEKDSAGFYYATWNFVLRSSIQRELEAGSGDSLATMAAQAAPERIGLAVLAKSLEHLAQLFPRIMEVYENQFLEDGSDSNSALSNRSRARASSDSLDNVNILQFFLQTVPGNKEIPSQADDMCSSFIHGYKQPMLYAGIRTISLIFAKDESFPQYRTFRQRLDYKEDILIRDVDPSLAYQLELKRLNRYEIEHIPTHFRAIRLYFGQRKSDGPVASPSARRGEKDTRFFVRAIVRYGDITRPMAELVQMERIFDESLKALEVGITQPAYEAQAPDCNHIFINVVPDVHLQLGEVEEYIRNMIDKYTTKVISLKISQIEIKITFAKKVGFGGSAASTRRVVFLANNTSGSLLRLHMYDEFKSSEHPTTIFRSIGGGDVGPWENTPISEPYPVISTLQLRRRQAQLQDTTYVYDFPELFEGILLDIWSKAQTSGQLPAGTATPKKVLIVTELMLTPNSAQLKSAQRPPGGNDIGMVAWKFAMFTPEHPEGREVIVIANDITFQSGSFGPQEDMLFLRASEYARAQGLPRIYLAANSGARIGLAKEVQDIFRIAWTDPLVPSKGFRYLYLTPDDHERLSKTGSVHCEKVVEEGETRFRIIDIIGLTDGLGVENLRGSGMIAGETSRAYKDIFTISYVSGRSVGIGAYLVRLGQRVIQKATHPIILTGAEALNKVLGREVYHSNVQLGGIRIMYHNGVTHQVVESDIQGVTAILDWLSFVPRRRGELKLPAIRANPSGDSVLDPVDRDVESTPSTVPYDPREVLDGHSDAHGKFVKGFFDRGTFVETMAGWAKTVVVGRAKLGGIPVGVIAVETRTVEHIIPADPANVQSKEEVLQQPGQVWFPDSAYKTAQAIEDFNRGEQLPLMIFANWRGFSAGMRDMFDQVLKFGAYIVDQLRDYRQPIMVYIPPYGELRGGSWVVVDPTINSEYMEMYADPLARGGVLEPSGIIAIKYRRPDIIKTMRRLDSQLSSSSSSGNTHGLDAESQSKRIEALYPVYEQAATSFADLHDTPGRMKAKGVITDVIPWAQSRRFFYWHLRRRLLEERIRRQLATESPDIRYSEVKTLVAGWYQGKPTQQKEAPAAVSDKELVEWIEANPQAIQHKVSEYVSSRIARRATEIFTRHPNSFIQAIASQAANIPEEIRDQIIRALSANK